MLLEWVFLAIFHVLDWNFPVLNFYGNLCNWIPKLIWPRCDWFWVFCWKSASSVDFLSKWTEIFKKCSIVFPFWRHQIFSMFSLRCILVCSLKILVLFSHRVLYYWLLSFRKAIKLYFLSFSVFQSFFFEVVAKLFDYFWKPNSLFSENCVNCLLMFYFVYCNNRALKHVNGGCY